jgi:hypothetical protein
MHLYIVVECKTQDCRTVHVLMHLGEKGKTPARVEYWLSYPLLVDCPTCGKTYDDSHSEEKFWQKELPPPPNGHSDRLAAPALQDVFPPEEDCRAHSYFFATITCMEAAVVTCSFT